MSGRGAGGAMPCHYPQGASDEWCERHQKDHAMIVALRAQPTAVTLSA